MDLTTKETIVVKKTLQQLIIYQGEENALTLQSTARHLESVKTWGALKGFINLLQDQSVRDFMVYPVRIIESVSERALLPSEKPNWKVINPFKKTFTEEDGPFRWPVSDDTELTRQHLGALCLICRLPGYGRNLWDGYTMTGLLTGQKDGAHLVGMVYYKALYFSLPELPKRKKKE